MMFFILDSDPHKSVQYLIDNSPRRFYAKQLIELGQLICSAGISDVYKSLKGKGKEQQEWIRKHPGWTYQYYVSLYKYCTGKGGLNYKAETVKKFIQIINELDAYMQEHCESLVELAKPSTAIWRYKSTYTDTIYPTNSELAIDTCVTEYRRYLIWKQQHFKLLDSGQMFA